MAAEPSVSLVTMIMANACPDHRISPVSAQVSEVTLRVLKTAAPKRVTGD